MRKNQSSLTAAGIAIVRAIESEKPVHKRICCDHYARQFVSGSLFRFVRFFDRLGYGERKGPGVMGFLVSRERHIDEYLKACLAGGIQQLVILGAGFDARAYRFEELKRGVKVFEVDHPATQQAKRVKVKQIFGQEPEHVVYVPVDFNTQTLEQRLFECGYDETRKTLFIWQGVTQYLAPAAVDSTLALIAHHSGDGSAVIFDYMYPTLLDGSIQHGEVANIRNKRWLSGEDFTFGIADGAVTGFLEQRGFHQIHDANNVYLHGAYFTGENAKRKVTYGYAIVSAVVKPK
jgi:methyltransferase (TIGR00027 family)